MKKFDYSLDFKSLNFRERPNLYVIGKGEQGVLSVEPYKSEILPNWTFKNPEAATKSSNKIYEQFLNYLKNEDFVGADMARKFLQMGFTRARRYANYPGGKKYIGPVPSDKKGQSGAHGREIRPRGPEDPIKAEAASIFKEKWKRAEEHVYYQNLKTDFLDKYG